MKALIGSDIYPVISDKLLNSRGFPGYFAIDIDLDYVDSIIKWIGNKIIVERDQPNSLVTKGEIFSIEVFSDKIHVNFKEGE